MKIDIFGRLDLGVKILVQGDCLGKHLTAQLGEYEANLIIPSALFTTERPIITISDVSTIHSRALKQIERSEEESWGSVHSYNTESNTILSAGLIALCLSIKDFPSHGIEYSNYLHGRGRPKDCQSLIELWKHADNWLNLFRRWVAVLSGQTTNPDQAISNISTNSCSLELVTLENEIVSLPSNRGDEISIIIPNEKSALSFDKLKTIIDLVNKNHQPQLSHELIEEARNALYRSEFRKSIIESSAAVEMILNQFIREEMNSFPRKLSNALLEEKRTLGPLAKLVATFKKIPDLRILIETRNAVVHKGFVPTHEKTREVFALACEVTDMVNKY